MPDKMDDLKGRVEQAAGDLADDDELRRRGKDDRSAARVKSKARDLADKAREGIGEAEKKGREVVDKAEHKARELVDRGREARKT